jgi:hypothetical protein
MATNDPDCVLALGHKVLTPLYGTPATPLSLSLTAAALIDAVTCS